MGFIALKKLAVHYNYSIFRPSADVKRMSIEVQHAMPYKCMSVLSMCKLQSVQCYLCGRTLVPPDICVT
jgi:hypothetical protein